MLQSAPLSGARERVLYTALSFSIDTPSAMLTATDASSERGCRAKVRPEPPTRMLAPAPTPRPMSPETPTYSPASAPGAIPWVGREHGPGEHAAGRDAEVETDGGNCSLVGLRRVWAICTDEQKQLIFDR
jgi:hypothetical protein